jgi:hypothetical protein
MAPGIDPRREAVQLGRKGIGRRLQLMLEDVVQQPIPGYWLALLRAADHKASIQDEDAKKRRA